MGPTKCEEKNGLLYFPRLDTSGTLVPTYTVGLNIVDQPDEWTRRFLRAKDGENLAVIGASAVFTEALKRLVAEEGLPPRNTVLIHSLSSAATAPVAESMLHIAGRAAAAGVGTAWFPEILSKKPHRSLHSISGGADRDAEVKGVYTAGGLQNTRAVIILDDFVTRGATFGDIYRAVQATTPGVKVLGLALGKSERQAWAEKFGVTLSNERVPVEFEHAWTEAVKK